MENQHQKIKGYRDLTQEEIDLMNRVKELGPEIQELVSDITDHIIAQTKAAFEIDNSHEMQRITESYPSYWLAEGETSMQKGLMFLTRAIAQPTTF